MTNAVTIEVLTERLNAKLMQVEERIGNLNGPMAVIGRKLKTRILLGFRSSTSPWGDPWLPLQYRVGKPLQDTGRLMASINYQVGAQAGQPHVDIGTNVDYARVHQFGATIEIPARSQRVYRSLLKNGDFARGAKFVKKDKTNFSSWATMAAYTVTIPARPYLPLHGDELDLPFEWRRDATDAVGQHIERVLYNSGRIIT